MSPVNYNNPPVPFPNPVRYNLATPLSNRNELPEFSDGLMQNVYVEQQKNGKLLVCKRPGFTASFVFGGTVPQGLFYFKGYYFGASSNVLYNLSAPVANNYATGAAWTLASTPTWQARDGVAAVVFRNQIIVIGGQSTLFYNDVWGTSDGENWTQLCAAAPWGKRFGVSAAVFNDRLYISCGDDGVNRHADVWVTDDGSTWTLCTGDGGFPARSGHQMVAFNSGLFLMGGVGNAGFLNDVWFSNDGTSWVQMVANATWAARVNFGAGVLGDELFVYGGGGVAPLYNDCYATKDGITWTLKQAACFASARSNFASVVYEGKLWALGGLAAGPTYLPDVYSSPDGVAWTLITAAPGWTGRYRLAAVAFRAPTAVSPINTPILWILGGSDNVSVVANRVYRSNVNGAVNAAWSIPVITGNLRLDSCTSNAQTYLVLKDTDAMYVFTGNTLSRVKDTNYPKKTVPGVVNLDETVYVMDPSGIIYGSSIENPMVWPAFKFIGADYESDGGVAVAKHKNYLVAFGEFTTQLFYDAGSPSGPVIRPVKNADITIGCASPDSIVDCDDTLVFIGRGRKSTGRKVFAMKNAQVTPISDPNIERVMELTTTFTAHATYVKQNGHRFYVLRFVEQAKSFAYDLDTGLWFRVTFKGGVWDLSWFATDGFFDYYLRDSAAEVYIANPKVYQDAGTPILIDIYTNVIDADTNRQKFCGDLALVGDRANGIVSIRYNDNDYNAGSWSAFRTINTSGAAKNLHLSRQGRFIRRAYNIQHSDDAPFRQEAIELMLSVGFH